MTGNNAKLVFEKIPGVRFSEIILERRLKMDIVIAVIVAVFVGGVAAYRHFNGKDDKNNKE